jgi:hypothetical protein
MKAFRRNLIVVVIFLSVLLYSVCASTYAIGRKNLFTKSGLLSNLKEDEKSKNWSITIELPPSDCQVSKDYTKVWQEENCKIDKGTEYAVKVNFLKVESVKRASDAYATWKSLQEGKPVTEIVDRIANIFQMLKSRADLKLYDSGGNLVEHIEDLGATTIGKKGVFIANDTRYKIEIICLQGAGLYHLVFERGKEDE